MMDKAKFNVGQVVMMTGLKKPRPFVILDRYQTAAGWFYFWNRKNAAAEHMIRALTLEEIWGKGEGG